MGHAQGTGHAQRVHLQPPHQHGMRAQGQGFENIGAAANAAVQQHWVVGAHRSADGRQHLQGGGGAVEAAAAVVGHDHARHAPGLHLACIVWVHHALDPHGQAGLLHQPLQVCPGGGVVHGTLEHAAVPGLQRQGGGRCVVAQVLGHTVGRHAEARLQRAPAGGLDGRVHRHDDGAVACGLGAPNQVERGCAVGLKVQLKPARRGGVARLGNRFQRGGRQRAGHQAGVGCSGRAGGFDLAVGVCQFLKSDRGQRHRVGPRLACHHGAHVAMAHIAQRSRQHAPLGKCLQVGRHGKVVAAATGDVGMVRRRHEARRQQLVVERVAHFGGNVRRRRLGRRRGVKEGRGHHQQACRAEPGIGSERGRQNHRRHHRS